jgi:N-acetylglucosaminyldiphosphoundecaprenol N-acetyl-beta-D-mannosaminyltransferase
MRDLINILGVNLDNVTINSAYDRIIDFLKGEGVCVVYTPNSEMIMSAYEQKNLMDVLNSSDLSVPDGIGVVYASRILKKPLKERVAGFDLAKLLLSKIPNTEYSVFLFGGAHGVADKAKENLEIDYPGIKIVGLHNGYFDVSEEDKIINEINESQADILFVFLGFPKQEHWINRNKDKLNVKVCMGLGGSLDIFAGQVKRAPYIYRRLGIEWLYRLIREPKRYKRMLALPKFGVTVIWKAIRKG